MDFSIEQLISSARADAQRRLAEKVASTAPRPAPVKTASAPFTVGTSTEEMRALASMARKLASQMKLAEGDTGEPIVSGETAAQVVVDQPGPNPIPEPAKNPMTIPDTTSETHPETPLPTIETPEQRKVAGGLALRGVHSRYAAALGKMAQSAPDQVHAGDVQVGDGTRPESSMPETDVPAADKPPTTQEGIEALTRQDTHAMALNDAKPSVGGSSYTEAAKDTAQGALETVVDPSKMAQLRGRTSTTPDVRQTTNIAPSAGVQAGRTKVATGQITPTMRPGSTQTSAVPKTPGSANMAKGGEAAKAAALRQYLNAAGPDSKLAAMIRGRLQKLSQADPADVARATDSLRQAMASGVYAARDAARDLGSSRYNALRTVSQAFPVSPETVDSVGSNRLEGWLHNSTPHFSAPGHELVNGLLWSDLSDASGVPMLNGAAYRLEQLGDSLSGGSLTPTPNRRPLLKTSQEQPAPAPAPTPAPTPVDPNMMRYLPDMSFLQPQGGDLPPNLQQAMTPAPVTPPAPPVTPDQTGQ